MRKGVWGSSGGVVVMYVVWVAVVVGWWRNNVVWSNNVVGIVMVWISGSGCVVGVIVSVDKFHSKCLNLY